MNTQALAERGASSSAPAGVTAEPMLWQDYQVARSHWFRTAESFKWFQRQNLAELNEAGALAVISGRVWVVPEAFDAAVIAIGRRLAAARAA